MSPSDDDTRPISVAELLARNGTIGSPPVTGHRRRRRSGGISVAELTGEIPIIRPGDIPPSSKETAPAAEPEVQPASPLEAEAAVVAEAETESVTEAAPEEHEAAVEEAVADEVAEETAGEALVESALGDEAAVEQAAAEDVSVEEVAVEDAAVEEVAVEEAALDEVAVEEVALDEVAVEEVAADEVAVEDEAAVEEAAAEDMPSGEDAVAEAELDEPVSEDSALDEIGPEETGPAETAEAETAEEETAEEVAADEVAAEVDVAEENASEVVVAEVDVAEEDASEVVVAEEGVAEEDAPDGEESAPDLELLEESIVEAAPEQRRAKPPKSRNPRPRRIRGLQRSHDPRPKRRSAGESRKSEPAPPSGAEQMNYDPVDEAVSLPGLVPDRPDGVEELRAYLQSSDGTLFSGESFADDLARRVAAPAEEVETQNGDQAQSGKAKGSKSKVPKPRESRMTSLRYALLAVLQSLLAVVFGGGLFIAFDQLWRWNNIVALVLSVLVILGLVVAVRVVRKTEDIASTLIAVVVGALVTLGPLALLQSI